jgi:signal peptidase II
MSRPSLANFRSLPPLLAFALTAVVGLGLDLWTKRAAFDALAPWGIEQVDEVGPRQGALQVVPRRSLSPGDYGSLGIRADDARPAAGHSVTSRPAGVVVDGVFPFSPAADAVPVGDAAFNVRLEPGDVVVAVNGRPVSDAQQLAGACAAAVAALNQWYAQPAAHVERERADPPAPKGIDLTVLKVGRPVVLRVRPSETALVHPFIPRGLHFQALVNQGAVFGIGQGQRWLFLVVSTLAIGFILYLFASSGRHRFYQFVLGLLLAGVIGNMYDRLHLGFVRDMIHGLPGRTWPGSTREVFPWIFNVADSWLCAGVGLIFLYTLRGAPGTRDRKEGEKADAPNAEPAAEA